MGFELKNKTALVSGSSQGIGFAIAEALAKEGVNLIINSNNTDRVDQAVDKLSKVAPGVRISGAVADLSTAERAQQLVENAPAVDALVNNVGFYTAKEFEEITDAEWDRMMNLNFMSGVVYLCSPLAAATTGPRSGSTPVLSKRSFARMRDCCSGT
jgi:NAD(P)-dependent dehydrogenase (short-subunit alcohol dehydrogenase family)